MSKPQPAKSEEIKQDVTKVEEVAKPQPTSSKQGWEERFDNKFLGFKSDEVMDGHYGLIVSNEVAVGKIKSFIQQEIDRAEENAFKRGANSNKASYQNGYRDGQKEERERCLECVKLGWGNMLLTKEITSNVSQQISDEIHHIFTKSIYEIRDKIKNG